MKSLADKEQRQGNTATCNKERMALRRNSLVPIIIPVRVQEEKTEEDLGVAAPGDQEFVIGRSKTA